MKAIGFFLAVFLSMLTVFLVATGEVKRWFAKDPAPLIAMGNARAVETPRGASKNIFEFPFYDFEQAALKFVIRAEFIQEEFGVSSQIDKMDKLSLRNGVIEMMSLHPPPHRFPNPRSLPWSFNRLSTTRKARIKTARASSKSFCDRGRAPPRMAPAFISRSSHLVRKGCNLAKRDRRPTICALQSQSEFGVRYSEFKAPPASTERWSSVRGRTSRARARNSCCFRL
jgi:hypothetical protein